MTSDHKAKLSAVLARLGERAETIRMSLDRQGLVEPLNLSRLSYRRFCADEDAFARLSQYWLEYAKERLSALKGPMSLLRRKLPPHASYRSALLDQLYKDASSLKSEGPISSPPIEPTVKRYVELMPSDPVRIELKSSVRRAQEEAVTRHSYDERVDYAKTDARSRYDDLIELYATEFARGGYRLASKSAAGCVFTRAVQGSGVSVAFIDESMESVCAGKLEIQFAVVANVVRKGPQEVVRSALANFRPEDLLPGWGYVNWFKPNSYAQLRLAAAANCALAIEIATHLDELWMTSEG